MKFKISLITAVISVFVLFSSLVINSSASEIPAEAKIETWADTHPRAASELVDWMKTYKEGAQAITKWDYKHPEQSKSFINWVITYLGKRIDVFIEEHEDWRRFNKIVVSHREALNAFVVWCRFHPKATAELMQHPKALHWAKHHLNIPDT